MASRSNRRDFMKTSAVSGIGFWVAAGLQADESKSPNSQIAIASVGIGGKGESDSDDAEVRAMVAICDVAENRLNAFGESKFPQAKRYTDYRKMLEEMRGKIDAVTVSTPDHMHAPVSLMAMRMGIHCFCQKPLTRTIYEARLMAQVAKEKKLATQMGNQGTAESGLRRLGGDRQGRHAGTGQGSPRLDQPADMAPRHAAPEGREMPHRIEVERMARRRPGASLCQRRLSHVRMARLVGFRLRRLGRHGLPHHEHALHGA